MASYNRIEKTLNCIKSIYSSCQADFDIYLTDDNSSDGTVEAVNLNFPNTKIIKGSGNLYWAGGMRSSWLASLKMEYDGYLLINDDTVLLPSLFSSLFVTDDYSIRVFSKRGVYVGTTISPKTNEITYGGRKLLNRFLYKTERVFREGEVLECDLTNANILFVSKEVVREIGILSVDYIHGSADFDYSLFAKKNGIPVLVMPQICGYCEHEHKSIYSDFKNISIKERYRWLWNPVGLSFGDQLTFMRKFFPHRYPFILIAGLLKVIFPKVYIYILKFR